MTYPEPFDAEHVRPTPAACTSCSCCSAQLCEEGRKVAFGCAAQSSTEDKPLVQDCPCSAETTVGTAAYWAAQTRAKKRAEQGGDRG